MKKGIVLILLVVLVVLSAALAGCSDSETDAATGGDGKSAILVVSFGTSYNDNRDLSIGGIEKALETAYPDYEIRRAFTSQIIIDILKERDEIEVDNVTAAMDRLVADGVKEVIVQPTHVMPGQEFHDIVKEVNNYRHQFDTFKFGNPILAHEEDYEELVSIITADTKAYDVDGTAIVFMGHGTHHLANACYAKVQEHLTAAGFDRYFVGTVEATPSLEDVMAAVKASGATKVVLQPLMIVAGDHASNDMAGDEEGSWKLEFQNAGFQVETVLRGLGEMEGIQQLMVKHVAATIAE